MPALDIQEIVNYLYTVSTNAHHTTVPRIFRLKRKLM